MWRIKHYANLIGCYPPQPLASVDNILLDLRTSKLFVFWLQRRFPDFSYITRAGRLTQHLDCVIIRYIFLSLISWLFMNESFTLKLRKLKHLQNILQCNIYICYSPAGRSVLGETVPKVLSTVRGRTQTEGTVSPNTDRPRLVNNIFIFFPTEI